VSGSFFDTSVLRAAFVEDHEHHDASLRGFEGVTRKTGSRAAHTLAELYATTTRLPGRHRLSAEQALLLLENVTKRLILVNLDGEEYVAAIEAAASAGSPGERSTMPSSALARQSASSDHLYMERGALSACPSGSGGTSSETDVG